MWLEKKVELGGKEGAALTNPVMSVCPITALPPPNDGGVGVMAAFLFLLNPLFPRVSTEEHKRVWAK